MNGRALFLFIVPLLAHGVALGQFASVGGKFSVDQIKGCVPFTITVTPDPAFPCGTTASCAAFYEDDVNSVPLVNPPYTHTYTQPGIYTLKILRQTLYDSITIEVTANTQPQFQVYTCINNEVSVKLNDSNYDEYIVDFKDGSAPVTVNGTATVSHVYAPGMQTVEVEGHNTNAAYNCTPGGAIVTPRTTLPAPTINLLEVLDDQSIRLSFDAQSNIQYKLGIATNSSTTFQQVKTIYNATVDTIFNLQTDANYYCFQLAAFDPCNNTVINSAVICSAKMDVAVRNNVIDVAWTSSTTGVSDYRLTRTATDGAVLVTTPTRSPYADGGVVCGTEYCYELTINYSNGSRSVSLPKCGTGFSTDIPTAIRNITSIVSDNSVILQWQTDPDYTAAEFSVEKSAGGNFEFLATTTQNNFADNSYDPAQGSCYRISYKDVCDNQSPLSVEACPINLTGNLRNDNTIVLTWTAYQGWSDGVAGYTIEKYAEDGTLLQTIEVGNTTTYVDASDDVNHQMYVYVIQANAAEPGLEQSVSNRVTILKDPNIFHPTAFTPNGDNLNDVFTVFGQYVVGFEMKIFNRWGELLYTTDDIFGGWDGRFRGLDMPEGTYTFIAHITDRAGRTFKRSGSVLLLRKN